ncbi:MAG TPA: cytochrome c oxidase subunit 3 [Blastocatellia bacterium]|nr:cytochrome c oxidase subunit 3 [Blastocatellia bacterium]
MMRERTALDVSHLPAHVYGSRAPLWWGNLLLIVIEGTMFALAIASYFYLRKNFAHWPPPPNPLPEVLLPTINLFVILVSLAPAIRVHVLAVNEGSQFQIQLALLIEIAFIIAVLVLRFYEFPALHCLWNSHAYGSITWALLGLHLLHLVASVCESMLLFVWTLTHTLDKKHRLDLSLLAIYWYFVVASWVVIYAVVFLSPRVM